MANPPTVFNRLRSFAEALSDRGLATYAASCAFYAFLSLFPLTALAASLVPCIGVSEAALLHLMEDIVPADVAAPLKVILSNVYANVFPALPLSMVTLLWSSARAFSELLKGLAAMTASERRFGYLRRRLRAMLLTAALLTALLLSLAVLVFGTRIALLVGLVHPEARGTVALILRLRYLAMAGVLWLMFVFLYRFIPGKRYSFREAGIGAALAAGAWIAFSSLFSLYADHFLDLTLYGSMAALALIMLWLFYCQYIILIGAGICAWKHSKKEAVPLGTAS